MGTSTRDLIADYYTAFNAGDTEDMIAIVSDDIRHDMNQSERRMGKTAFIEFNERMTRCYKEQLTDIVIMVDNEDNTRGSAEYIVNGEYIATDDGLPEAKGQTYSLPAGTFFELGKGKITRITTYFNLQDWISQVDV